MTIYLACTEGNKKREKRLQKIRISGQGDRRKEKKKKEKKRKEKQEKIHGLSTQMSVINIHKYFATA